MEFYYKVYGLNIKSQIEVNEFILNKNENNDIEIFFGEMPQEVKESRLDGSKAFYSKTKVWFHIENVGTYYITNGNTIMVEPCEDTDMQLLKVYLMCSCLGFIMLEREQVAIHGGVIEINNKAIIFTGDRGAGKSTLTTALRKKEYKLISDDVASILVDNVPFVYHGFPYQKLCEDAMETLGYNKEGYTSIYGDGKTKYIVPAHESFCEDTLQLSAICEISADDIEEVKIEEVTGSEKLKKIFRNVYREEFIHYMGGFTPKYFKKCVDIAKNIKFYKIIRPTNGFTVNRQIELIEEKLGCNSKLDEKVS